MDSKNNNYDYQLAFSRNLGWFTPQDQKILSTKVIAIPGLGGVGGHHLHNFLRIGYSKFHIADPDFFEIQNFNRQFGATVSSIGKSKVETLHKIALDINPNVDIKSFPEGVNKNNMLNFLKGVDVVVDALDLYAMDIRIELYDLAYKMGIPVITSGPFGMGTSILAFHPNNMSFNDYFDLNRPKLTTEAKIIRFLAGITPNTMHRSYLRYPEAINLFERRLASLNIGCSAATAAMGAMVTQILLDRDDKNIRWAPRGFHVDFNLQKSYRFFKPWGNRNPLQYFKIKFYHKFFHKPEFIK